MKATFDMLSKNPSAAHCRVLVFIDVLKSEPYKETTRTVEGVIFQVKEYAIGWDLDKALKLVELHDGEVDGIILAGIREYASFGKVEAPYTKVREVVRAAKKTVVYTGYELQPIFAHWALRRAEKLNPGLFTNKHVLFHAAMFTPFAGFFQERSERIYSADPLLAQLPMRLRGPRAIETFLRTTHPLISRNIYYRVNFLKSLSSDMLSAKLSRWIADCDVFVTYHSLLKEKQNLESLKGKILVIDWVSPELKQRLISADVAQIVTFMPDLSNITDTPIHSFGLLHGVIDQIRLNTQSTEDLPAFTLSLIERADARPQSPVFVTPPLRRCAFVVHPLSSRQLFSSTGLNVVNQTPKALRKVAEDAMAHLPIFHFGQVRGARSELTGQEVICDMYAITATPKALLRMNEEDLYGQLVKAANAAKESGSLMMGLGAYTKVAGDAGVTVARRAPLPITTGNSYSAAATLWAARFMVEKMQGFSPDFDSPAMHQDSKAMVIGATGSIGRVSALLLAESFKEIVLVATRADKLLELKEEILESHPSITVKIATSPDSELPTTDLVVTATSSYGKRILDIMMVKPGAVICDCSRPLDISEEDARRRPDIMVIESGEIDLPGMVEITGNIGLPKPSVYACLAETVLLTMEGRYESFSISRNLSLENVKEIYRIGRKHGAKLSAIHGYQGVVTDEMIETCKQLAAEKMKTWNKN
jgi:predicted amino acid dehydrogenase